MKPNHHCEICEYAEDAYHAINQAKEDLPGFNNLHMAENKGDDS